MKGRYDGSHGKGAKVKTHAGLIRFLTLMSISTLAVMFVGCGVNGSMTPEVNVAPDAGGLPDVGMTAEVEVQEVMPSEVSQPTGTGGVTGTGGSNSTGGSTGSGGSIQLGPVHISAHERIVYGFDSFSTGYNGALPWPTGPGNFVDQVNAQLGVGNEVTAIGAGRPGTGVDYLLANIQTFIFDNDPTMVILMEGLNDTGGTDTPDFVSKYESVITQLRAWKPSIKILSIGLGPKFTEIWSTDSSGNPIWNPDQPGLDKFDSYVKEAAAAMNVVFVDWRKWLLKWEVIHNPTHAALSAATVDSTHLSDVGQKELAAAILQPTICVVDRQ